jgi:hypothetical protein
MDAMRAQVEAAIGKLPDALWRILVELDVAWQKDGQDELTLPLFIKLATKLEFHKEGCGLILTREVVPVPGVEQTEATLTWTGELPKGTRYVDVQLLRRGGFWETCNVTNQSKGQAVEKLEGLVKKGPCNYPAYRLVPSEKQFETITETITTQEGETVTMAKKVVKTSGKASAELVAGKWKASSFRAKLYLALQDGKNHSGDALIKAIGATSNLGDRSPRAFLGPIIKDLRDAKLTINVEGDTYNMGGKAIAKANGKDTTPKKATPKKKAAKAIASPAEVSEGEVNLSE